MFLLQSLDNGVFYSDRDKFESSSFQEEKIQERFPSKTQKQFIGV